MPGEQRQLARIAVERGADLRAVEAELDHVDAARAQRKRRAADDDADQHARDEAQLHDDQRDGDERQVFESRQPPGRLDQPAKHQVEAEIEQHAAQHELRHVPHKAGIGEQDDRRNRRNGETGQPPARAGCIVDRGAGQRNAAHIAAQRRRNQVGDPERVEIAFEVGLAPRRELDSGGVEQHADRGDEHHGQQFAGESGQRTPRKMREVVGPPRQDQPDRGLRREQPAVGLGLRKRRAGHNKTEVPGSDEDRHYDWQTEAFARSLHGDVERTGDPGGRQQFGKAEVAGERGEIADGQRFVGDHPHRAVDHHPAGRAQKSPDHRIRHEPNGAAGAGETKPAQQEAGERGAERHRDQRRHDQLLARDAGAGELMQQCRDQRRHHRRGRGVRAADGERQRAPHGDDRGADC
jgi:hypothetical protein